MEIHSDNILENSQHQHPCSVAIFSTLVTLYIFAKPPPPPIAPTSPTPSIRSGLVLVIENPFAWLNWQFIVFCAAIFCSRRKQPFVQLNFIKIHTATKEAVKSWTAFAFYQEFYINWKHTGPSNSLIISHRSNYLYNTFLSHFAREKRYCCVCELMTRSQQQ